MSRDLLVGLGVLDEPGGLETVLIGAGRLSLVAEVQGAAELAGLTPVAFARLATRRFIDRAGDEDWATVVSRANAGEDAFGAAIAAILERAVRDAKEVFQ